MKPSRESGLRSARVSTCGRSGLAGAASTSSTVNLPVSSFIRISCLPSRCRGPAPRHRFRHCRCRSRSEEHTSELQSLMRISYAVFCLKTKNTLTTLTTLLINQNKYRINTLNVYIKFDTRNVYTTIKNPHNIYQIYI